MAMAKKAVAKKTAKKAVFEKATGEKYASKAAMMKHEKSESKAERFKEYGKKPTGVKNVVKKAAKKPGKKK